MFGFLFASLPVNNSRTGGVASPQDEDARSDRRDIERFLQGSQQGFEDLMNRYRQSAYGIALGLTGNHDDAMDAVQRAFINVHRSLRRFRLDEPFFPWLYRIVRNAALNQKRNESRHRGDIPLEWADRGDGRPDPLQQAEAEDLRRRMWEALADLPEAQREVFLLYHFQGLKYRQIAAALGIPTGTVMSRLHNARLRLRTVLGLEGE